MLLQLLLLLQICFWKFNFAKLLLLLISASLEDASYCRFRKAVSNNFFQKVLLTNFISTYANLLQHYSLLTFC